MGTTNRLGLERFGGTLGGQLSDKGYKFSNQDRAIIDAFLQALEGHSHTGGTRLDNPVGAPQVVLDGTQGAIPAGTTLYYRVGFVDAYGLETAASVEVSVSTQFALDQPAPPALQSQVGGDLLPGQYQYAVSAVQNDGSETTPSGASTVTLNGGEGGVVLSLPVLETGAVALRIYRKAPGESQLYYLTATASASYTDTGGVVDATRTPSLTNTTNSKNSVLVTAPDLGVGGTLPANVASWRIYRASGSGEYGDAALVHDVVEHTSETDPTTPLLVTWRDTGAPLANGLPLDISTTFQPPTSVDAGDQAYAPPPSAGSVVTQVDEALDELYVRSVATTRVPFGGSVPANATTQLKYAGTAVEFVVDSELAGRKLHAMTCRAAVPITAGTATVGVYINDVLVPGSTYALASGYQQYEQIAGTRTTLVAGDRVAVKVVATATLAPTPIEIAATVVFRAL
jgi:hypothetical protein